MCRKRPAATEHDNPAARAEPRGIGTARARDPLAREVKLLGSLLGQVIVDVPVLQRSIELRNPYVDSLSELQVLLLDRLRRLPADDARRPELLRLVHLTVSGVAAGLQNTG